MAWLGFGALASGLALHKLLRFENPPNKVQDVNSEYLQLMQVLQRNEALVLYASVGSSEEKKYPFEIVFLRPFSETVNATFSLYRAANLEEAEQRFDTFRERLPVFISIVKEYYNTSGLQKVCDVLAENPSWSLAHLIAYFNLTDYVNHPNVMEVIDYPDHVKYMTPFQLAIRRGNIEMVKALIPLSKLEHLDNDSNSVYHYAASTTKDIINLIAASGITNLNHCNVDGYTPLHLACLSDKPECVKALLVSGADVNITAKNEICKTSTPSNVSEFLQSNANKLHTQDMKYGGTPLHWSSSRQVIQTLIERHCDINVQNFDGKTALHVMVERNRLECVVELLSHDAEIDILDNNGNTPLHIAVEKKLVPIVQCLVVFGCNINLLNREGRSARHMVGKESSDSKEAEILYILHSVGAKRCDPTNSKCPAGCHAKALYNGIPPVAPESMEQRQHIQDMLSSASKSRNSFSGASKNGNSSSPTTANVVDTSAERKAQGIMDTLLAMLPRGTVKAAAPPIRESPSENGNKLLVDIDGSSNSKSENSNQTPNKQSIGRGRLLCLDGGGIRGLVLVQMLLEIEKLSQTPIIHLFDWVAGTSTGGILALAIGCGKTMRQCMGLYLRLKEHCFVGSRPYPSDCLEAVLQENLGVYTTMSDIQHPKIMVTGVMADRKPVDLHLFRNYTSASDILGITTSTNNRRVPPPKPEEQLIWQAARATGAAPSYFRASGYFLDGGLIANNPTLDAMTEIHEYNMALHSVGRENEAVPISVVVSLGTGLIPVRELKDIDVFWPQGITDTAKLAFGISAIGNLLVDQATATDGRVVDRARAWCSMIGIPYFRFNPQLPEEIAMDEKNDQKLVNMLWQAKAYMHSNRNKIIEMINLLK